MIVVAMVRVQSTSIIESYDLSLSGIRGLGRAGENPSVFPSSE